MANRENSTTDASRVIIVAADKIYGPFPDQETAQGWLDAPHDVGNIHTMFSLRDSGELGTIDRAHECGNRLQSIDEATQSGTRRRAQGA